jgi:hypothetical protein
MCTFILKYYALLNNWKINYPTNEAINGRTIELIDQPTTTDRQSGRLTNQAAKQFIQ